MNRVFKFNAIPAAATSPILSVLNVQTSYVKQGMAWISVRDVFVKGKSLGNIKEVMRIVSW